MFGPTRGQEIRAMMKKYGGLTSTMIKYGVQTMTHNNYEIWYVNELKKMKKLGNKPTETLFTIILHDNEPIPHVNPYMKSGVKCDGFDCPEFTPPDRLLVKSGLNFIWQMNEKDHWDEILALKTQPTLDFLHENGFKMYQLDLDHIITSAYTDQDIGHKNAENGIYIGDTRLFEADWTGFVFDIKRFLTIPWFNI